MAKYAHPDDTAAWLTANGINIDRIPVDSDLTISTDDEGQRTIHYEELACDSFGHVVAFGGGTRTVRRSAPLTVEPPPTWRPYEKPTREQLLAGEEPYVHEHTEATPAQWIWLWNRATPERRLEVAKDIRAHAALADRCFMGNHETRLDQQQARLTRLEAEREQARRDVESSTEAAHRAMEQRQEMATERYALQEQRNQLAAELTRSENTRDHLRRRAEQAEDLLRVAHETSNRSEAARARAMRIAKEAEAAIAELAQAIRLTREYVGEEVLPAVEGWSWYDALRRHAPNELAGEHADQPATEEQPDA